MDTEVTPSCGCVFCDLGDEPEMVDGKPMHTVDNDIVGNMGSVPCTIIAVMHTNGPDQRDCADCGKPIGNKPRLTLADGRVICIPCYAARK